MNRRCVAVRVDPSLFVGLMFPSAPGAWFRIDAGLPEDAVCVGRGYDVERDCFTFVFEHPSFAEVTEGALLPTFDGVRISSIRFSDPVTPEERAEVERLMTLQRDAWKRPARTIAITYGRSHCALREVLGGYEIHYEAEDVSSLLDLIRSHKAFADFEKARRAATGHVVAPDVVAKASVPEGDQ